MSGRVITTSGFHRTHIVILHAARTHGGETPAPPCLLVAHCTMMVSALNALSKKGSMTSSTIATWAEPVRWTADDLLRLSDAGFRFELVQGELVRMAPTGGSHGLRTGRLHTALGAYVDAHGLGEVAAAETGFDLTQPGDAAQTVLAPDIAFVRSEKDRKSVV